MEELSLYNREWYIKYVFCFYWALAEVMLIGTSGITSIEVLFTIISLLMTVGVFAYLISKISMIIEEINKDK